VLLQADFREATGPTAVNESLNDFEATLRKLAARNSSLPSRSPIRKLDQTHQASKSLSPNSRRSRRASRRYPSGSSTLEGAFATSSSTDLGNSRRKFLELCTRRNKYTIALNEFESSLIANDGELFDKIKSHYQGARYIGQTSSACWWRIWAPLLPYLTLLRPCGVEFVKVTSIYFKMKHVI
jgi:hypothetical protein